MTDADPYQPLVRVKPFGQGIERVKREPPRHLYQQPSDTHRSPPWTTVDRRDIPGEPIGDIRAHGPQGLVRACGRGTPPAEAPI